MDNAFATYRKKVEAQRAAWQKKPVLRELYNREYRDIVAALSPHRPVAEVGASFGGFKAFFPEAQTSDLVQSGLWIDREMDPQNLQFVPGELGNIVAIDVLHRLQRPLSFLRQASVALRPGGRLILSEPAVTLFSRILHGGKKETFDPDYDVFGPDGTPAEDDPERTFENKAIPHILFSEYASATLKLVPNLKLEKVKKSGGLLRPLTGGFGKSSYFPHAGFKTLLSIESVLNWPFASWLTGERMLIVLEKK